MLGGSHRTRSRIGTPSGRRGVSAVVSLALASATLTGVTVIEVATAPEVSAASSANYCGGVGTWNGSACVFTSRAASGSWSKPSWVGSFNIDLVGGGGGGKGMDVSSPDHDDLAGYAGVAGSLSSASVSASTVNFAIGGGGSAGVGDGNGGNGGTSTATGVSDAAGGTGGLNFGNCYSSWPNANQQAKSGPLSGYSTYGASGAGGTDKGSGVGACHPSFPSGVVAAGAGQAGGIVITFSSAPTPSDPSGLSATANPVDATFSVAFTPSGNLGGLTATYSLTCTATGGVTVSGSGSGSPVVTTTAATRGKDYTCSIQASTLGGTSNSASAAATLMPGAPQNTSVPTIAGIAALTSPAQVLTGFPGSWDDFGFTIDDTEYQWQVTDDSVSGTWTAAPGSSTSPTYTITDPGLAGKYLRLGVRTENTYGWSDWAFSASSLQVTQAPVFTAQSPPLRADVNSAYAGYTFAASGHRIAYSISSGALPAGVTLNSSTGALSGTPTVTGTFSYVVRATNDSGFVDTPSLELTVSTGVPALVVITQQPVGGPSRQLLATQPIVEVRDDSGLLVVAPQTITVTSTGTIGGTQAAGLATAQGTATFTNLTLAGLVDDTYTLTFTTGAISAVSDPTQVTPGTATTLLLATPPVAAAAAGAVMATQPVVLIKDADGNTTGDDSVVTLTPEAGGFVGPLATDVATATAIDGIATFTGVRFGGPIGVAKQLTFSTPGLADDSASVTSTAVGAAYKLVVTTEASSPSASGAAFTTPPQVTRQDMGGNTVSGEPQAAVTAALHPSASPPYTVLVGSTTRTTSAGIATFTGLGLSGTSGVTYTIRFTSTGLFAADDSVTAASGSAMQLSLSAPGAVPPGDTEYGVPVLPVQPKVQVVDSGNNPIDTAGVTVTASIVIGDGILTNTTAVTDDSGLASFTSLSLTGTAGVFTLRFAAPGYDPVDDTMTLLRAAQTVTLAPIGPRTLDDTPFSISATTSSGLRASFTSTTPAVCAVGGDALATSGVTGGAVSVLGGGTCTIVASQGGDDYYRAAPDDSESFTVAAVAQATLTLIAPATATPGQSVTLTTIGGSGTGAVTYAETADPGSICAVDPSTGAVTFSGGGYSCSFTATKAADAGFTAQTSAPAAISVSSGRTPQTVAFTSPVPPAPIADDTYVAAAAATSGLDASIAVQTGSPSVCTTTAGPSPVTVTFIATGTCVLEASQAGDGRFDPAAPVAVQTILVYDDTTPPSSGQRNQSIAFAALADRRIGSPDFMASASATSTLPVTLVSATPAVCTVPMGTVVHLEAPGTCTLTAQQSGDATFAAADPVTRSFAVTAGLPSAPLITAVSSGDGLATLAFTAPDDTGGSAIIGYAILATPVLGGPTVSASGCTASPCAVSGLTTGTAYTVRIAAVNGIGTGPYSLPSSTTVPGSRPLAVIGLTATKPTSTSVALAWTEPTSLGGGTFTRYDVYYRAAGGTWPSTPHTTIPAIGTTTTTVTGLAAGTAYEFLVAVVSSTNPQSTPPDPGAPQVATVIVAAALPPSSPQDLGALLMGGTTVMITWAFPASDGGSPITGYSVTLDRGGWCTPPVLDLATRTASCMAGGLVTGTTYALRAAAGNAVGWSSAATMAFTTPGIAPPPPLYPPGPPESVVASPGDRQVTVAWQPPASAGSFPITTYQAVAQPGGRACLATAPALTCTITELANGTPYTVAVRALNGAGWGPFSAASAPVTPQADIRRPGPVRDLRAEGITVRAGSTGRVTLRWLAPLDSGGSAITGYRVAYRQVGTTGYTRVTPDATRTTITVRGLTPGKAYWFRVRAANVHGYGPGERTAERVRIPRT